MVNLQRDLTNCHRNNAVNSVVRTCHNGDHMTVLKKAQNLFLQRRNWCDILDIKGIFQLV